MVDPIVILAGVLGGAVLGWSGFRKASVDGEPFNPQKFAYSMIAPLLGGLLAGLCSTDIQTAALAGIAGKLIQEHI